jgi:hypothetical protein
MRARNIKPGFFTNDQVLECEPLARLLFAGLWGMADRKGRLEDRPKKIRIQVLPCDNCDLDALLEQLRQRGLIHRYEVNSQHYIQVINFEKHQHPHHKEPDSLIPAPDMSGENPPCMPAQSRASPGQTSEPPVANPSDSLIPDSLIPESSLNSDDTQARERTPRKAGRKPSDRIRLPCDTLPPEWAQWTHTEMGWSDQAIQDVWAYFRDYWRGRTDKGAQKSDWEATWRVWCRKQNIRSGGQYGQSKEAGGYNPRVNQPSKSERFKHALVVSTLKELDAAGGPGGCKDPG